MTLRVKLETWHWWTFIVWIAHIFVPFHDSSSPKRLNIILHAKTQNMELNEDLVIFNRNLKQIAVISIRLQKKWALNYQNNTPINQNKPRL